MFNTLQQKWNVTGWRLLLILLTFAVGGSLSGYIGKKILFILSINAAAVYITVYIIIVTLIWPFMVLAVSIPFGQLSFFKAYLKKMFGRFSNRKKLIPDSEQLTKANDPSKNDKWKIAIFASGAGSNAQQIISYFKNHSTITVSLIVCNKPGAGVLNIAASENIPFFLIENEEFFRGSGYVPQLKKQEINFIVLAGFLWKIPQTLINAYPKRIINIHPALLPNYGGKGMYGDNVHKAVIENGEKESGITIHYVDEHYDNGDIIFQARCPVLLADTSQALAQRIHALEHAHFSKTIERILMNT